MKYAALILLFTFAGAAPLLHAQELNDTEREAIRAEIEKLSRTEEEAFKEGDCETTVSFFEEGVSFYANGRKAPSKEFILNFCKRIPRPFPESGNITDNYYVLSPTSAYAVRQIDFKPESDSAGTAMKEVITKVWSRTSAGWKIVHFHSSVTSVPRGGR